MVRAALGATSRSAPVELVSVPPGAARFVRDDGRVTIGFGDVTVVRL